MRIWLQGAVAGAVSAMIIVFWIAAGQMFTHGVRIAPKLPAASTLHCAAANATLLTNWWNSTTVASDMTSTLMPDSQP